MNRQQRRHADRHTEREPHPGDRVVLAFLSAGEPTIDFHLSTVAMVDSYLRGPLAYRLDARGWRLSNRSGANISRARNRLVSTFMAMDHEPEWLLMVDDDMRWEPHALEQLLAVAEPGRIVGGLCFAYGPGGRIMPTIFERGPHGRFAPPDPDYELPATPTLVEVWGTGGAFLLAHRDDLAKIATLMPHTPHPWFREVEVLVPADHEPEDADDPDMVPYWISEDLWFCHQARQAGIRMYVHTGVEVGHTKPHMLNRRLYDTGRADVVTMA